MIEASSLILAIRAAGVFHLVTLVAACFTPIPAGWDENLAASGRAPAFRRRTEFRDWGHDSVLRTGLPLLRTGARRRLADGARPLRGHRAVVGRASRNFAVAARVAGVARRIAARRLRAALRRVRDLRLGVRLARGAWVKFPRLRIAGVLSHAFAHLLPYEISPLTPSDGFGRVLVLTRIAPRGGDSTRQESPQPLVRADHRRHRAAASPLAG